MTTYRIENLHTQEFHMVSAPDRKTAHEAGQTIWPGVPVEVCDPQEHNDRSVYLPAHNQIMDALDGVFEAIPGGDYVTITRCLQLAKSYINTLEGYFRTRGYEAEWFAEDSFLSEAAPTQPARPIPTQVNLVLSNSDPNPSL